jgi:phosphatidylserine/phosphatidylglycerophosphate/cardiolipin synthase-like enzyme
LSQPAPIEDVIASVADKLPAAYLERLAECLAAGSTLASARSLVAAPAWKLEVDRLAAAAPPGTAPASLALALRAAGRLAEQARDQSVELVWTGPDAAAAPTRMTAAVVDQVIGAARDRVVVASYVAWDVSAVSAALVAAAARGVRVDLLLESPAEAGVQSAWEPASALGDAVAAVANLYTWRGDRRPEVNGKRAAMHAKFAVSDARRLLVTSANLTGHALHRNMELGLLVTGGAAPRRTQRLFDELLADGNLVGLATPTSRPLQSGGA